MVVIKCKACGGQTTVDSQNGIIVCEYCGTKQTLPLFTEDSERLLYESGIRYLSHSEYDKAENVFNQLLTIKPEAAELYWNLVLCKYGVTYVEDPKTQKYVPTCNRTHYAPIFSDDNYQNAIRFSSGEKKALFEEDAKTIDTIQKGILAVSKKEKPFDVFISYKETDQSGNRTKDSIKAQKLYESLTEAGYKVFFSRITLEDKIGTEYEPYIYAALYSSKVMLTVCSSKDNIEAVWVKNEWSRFLGFRQNDGSKTLLPLYFDMPKSDLPEEFSLLSAYDMASAGFEDELLRGIKKLIPLPILRAQRRKKILRTLGTVAACLVLVAGIAAAIILPKEQEKKRLKAEADAKAAEEAKQEQLRMEEEAAQSEANQKAYAEAMALFEGADYTAAKDAFLALGDYLDSAQMAENCAVQPKYDQAMQLSYDGDYARASRAFAELGDYKDSAKQAKAALLSWRKSLATAVSDSGYYTYYITPNGSVAVTTTGKEEIKVGENGKVLSIAASDGGPVLALYEDGTTNGEPLSNEKEIIQIVPSHWVIGDIVLLSDGTVGVSQEFLNNPENDFGARYFKEITEWKNLVQLSAHAESFGNASFSYALAGIDQEGKAYLCYQIEFSEPNARTFMEHSDAFQNLKAIDVAISHDWETGTDYINAAALTHDGKLVTYINGRLSSREAKSAIEVELDGENTLMLLADGTVVGANNVNTVVKLSDGNFILQSGTIDGREGCKTVIHDEWLARMD